MWERIRNEHTYGVLSEILNKCMNVNQSDPAAGSDRSSSDSGSTIQIRNKHHAQIQASLGGSLIKWCSRVKISTFTAEAPV